MIAALALATAWAAPVPVAEAVRVELVRAAEALTLEGADPPYLVWAQVDDGFRVTVSAALGSVLERKDGPERSANVLVRVGSPEFDQTNFEGWKDGFGTTELVLGDDPVALRHDLWLEVDGQYKDALEGLAAKQAALERRALGSETPDYAPGPPQQATAEAPPAPDPEAVAELARALSAVFLDHPGVEFSRVDVRTFHGLRSVVDTGGTSVTWPRAEVVVRAVARVRADDGGTMADSVVFAARDLGALPPTETMRQAVEALAGSLEAWRALPLLEDEYVGPVLFRGQAAPTLFHEVMVPALLGTPREEKPPKGSRVFTFDRPEEPGPLAPRRRVLPPGWSVVDDPGRDPTSPACYRFDLEGEPGRRVELVEDGVVREHLMSRTPSEAFPSSNGHARRLDGGIPRAGASDLEVTPARPLSERKLARAALAAAESYGLDHYLVVDRLREPWLADWDGGAIYRFGGGDDDAPTPVVVRKVWADGREASFRGVSLAGLDVRSLKEIEGAGVVREGLFTRGEVVRVRAPEVLVGEVVASPEPPDAEPPLPVPSPLAERR